MGELGLFYRLAPIVFMGGSLVDTWRAESDRGDQARRRRSCTARTSSISPTSTRRSTAPAAPNGADTQEALVKQLGQLLADPAARESSVAAAERVVEQLGGALDRTLAALEPYLLQLRLEMGAANA